MTIRKRKLRNNKKVNSSSFFMEVKEMTNDEVKAMAVNEDDLNEVSGGVNGFEPINVDELKIGDVIDFKCRKCQEVTPHTITNVVADRISGRKHITMVCKECGKTVNK